MQDLEARLTDAKGLSTTAQELLTEPASSAQIPALQELRNRAAQEPIAITELADIDLRLAALAWEARVHKHFAACLSGVHARDIFCVLCQSQKLVPKIMIFFGVDLKTMRAAGSAGVGGNNQNNTAAKGEGEADSAIKPAMEEVCAVVEEAKELEVEEALRVRLRHAALAALAWETTACVLLNKQQCASSNGTLVLVPY